MLNLDRISGPNFRLLFFYLPLSYRTACNPRAAECAGSARVTVDMTQTTNGNDFNYGIALCHAAGTAFAAVPIAEAGSPVNLECFDSCTDAATGGTYVIFDPPCRQS